MVEQPTPLFHAVDVLGSILTNMSVTVALFSFFVDLIQSQPEDVGKVSYNTKRPLAYNYKLSSHSRSHRHIYKKNISVPQKCTTAIFIDAFLLKIPITIHETSGRGCRNAAPKPRRSCVPLVQRPYNGPIRTNWRVIRPV